MGCAHLCNPRLSARPTGEYDAPVDCCNTDPALNDCVIPPQQD
ncbi:hypothetical protein [Sorangium sp. So ce542]